MYFKVLNFSTTTYYVLRNLQSTKFSRSSARRPDSRAASVAGAAGLPALLRHLHFWFQLATGWAAVLCSSCFKLLAGDVETATYELVLPACLHQPAATAQVPACMKLQLGASLVSK